MSRLTTSADKGRTSTWQKKHQKNDFASGHVLHNRCPCFRSRRELQIWYTTSRQNKQLAGKVVKNIDTPGLMSCSQSCLKHSWCTSTNFKESFGKSSKGNCELNKHEISPIRDESKLKDERGTTFTMFLKVRKCSCCCNMSLLGWKTVSRCRRAINSKLGRLRKSRGMVLFCSFCLSFSFRFAFL